MAIVPTYPGVYVEELPSGSRTITGVATSITAFVGRARRGPTDRPVRVQSFAEFERAFGGLWARSPMTYAVQHFFLNGGSDALIARVHRDDAAVAKAMLAPDFELTALSVGNWGNGLRARVDYQTRPAGAGESLFNLSIRDDETGNVERHVNLSIDPLHPRYARTVLLRESNLVRLTSTPTTRPDESGAPPPLVNPLTDNASSTPFANGLDGDRIRPDEVTEGNGLQAGKRGMWLLEHADIFNILCIPPFDWENGVPQAVWDKAAKFCEDRRAMLSVDPPAAWDEVNDVTTELPGLITRHRNASLFVPYVLMADPLQEGRLREFAPCGVMAGLFARTDTQRGVWKAPAGIDSTLIGVADLRVNFTDGENGQLNPLGVNCLRSFPVIGRVSWGARTLRGADELADDWKYVPVRRLALYIEESLFRGTKWVGFEPNDEPLWSQIRMSIGSFMHDLFRQGAFQGRTPREAYFVRCSSETTTQYDIDRGIVNIHVGFAPLQPAEFVVIKIQQIRDREEA
jgi:phage tail sheath protein FI